MFFVTREPESSYHIISFNCNVNINYYYTSRQRPGECPHTLVVQVITIYLHPIHGKCYIALVVNPAPHSVYMCLPIQQNPETLLTYWDAKRVGP
jgi:hypothetical protein